jgi:hypothetical protein
MWKRSTRRRSVRLLQYRGIRSDAGSSALKSKVLSQKGVCPVSRERRWRGKKGVEGKEGGGGVHRRGETGGGLRRRRWEKEMVEVGGVWKEDY